MRFRERQLHAQCLSADLKNRTRPVPSPFSSREAVASEKVIRMQRMRSNALNREFLERQKLARRGGCRLQFSNKRRRHACRYRIVLRHSESSIGAVRATKQPPALKAGTQEIRSARRAAAVIPLYGLTSAADRVKSEMARPPGVDVPMRFSSWFNHGRHKQHKSR